MAHAQDGKRRGTSSHRAGAAHGRAWTDDSLGSVTLPNDALACTIPTKIVRHVTAWAHICSLHEDHTSTAVRMSVRRPAVPQWTHGPRNVGYTQRGRYRCPPSRTEPVEPRVDERLALREDKQREKRHCVGHVEVSLRRLGNGCKHSDQEELANELEDLEPNVVTQRKVEDPIASASTFVSRATEPPHSKPSRATKRSERTNTAGLRRRR